MVPEAAISPGVLAPASFSVSGKQYLVAILPDGAYVGNPNLVAGLTFRPAKPGDIITVYGIGHRSQRSGRRCAVTFQVGGVTGLETVYLTIHQ